MRIWHWNRIGRLLLAVIALLGVAQLAQAQDVLTYYHSDLTGSPVAGSDVDGNIVWREDFTPYGERRQQQVSSVGNRRWFTGHPHEDYTGLTYAGARHYDPLIGRFMGVDPATPNAENQFSFNRYAYANDNPYRYVDPDGEFAFLIPLAIIAYRAYSAYDTVSSTIENANTISSKTASTTDKVLAVVDTASNVLGGKLGGKVSDAIGTVVLRAKAIAARDELARLVSKRAKGRPAVVTAGFNKKTGDVVAACSPGGLRCAENEARDALGGSLDDIELVPPVRPRRTGNLPKDVCPRCESEFGRDRFSPGTEFESDRQGK